MGTNPVATSSAQTAGSSVRSKIVWGLVFLNAALLLCWAMKVTAPNAAVAQVRRPSDYLMIPGEVIGGTTEAVYIVDTQNGKLGAMTFDDTAGKLSVMPPINLNNVFQAAAAGNLETGTESSGGRRRY